MTASPLEAPTSPIRSGGTRHEPRRRPWHRERKAWSEADPSSRNGRDSVVDVAFAFSATGLAMVGFGATFDGISAQAVGVVSATGALLVAVLAARRNLSPLGTLFLSAVGFVVFAGPAMPEHAVAGILPGPGTPAALLDGMVAGWKDLLTTAPPVGLEGGLGAVPHTTAFASALVAGLLALRGRRSLLPAAPATAAVGISIILGDREPVSVLLQGALFVALVLAWAAIRGNRDRRNADGGIYWPRIVGAAVMLVAVTGAGLMVGSALPFVADHRYIAREDVIPPFDPRDYPSPLAAFRSYRLDHRDDVLFTVDGLPEGARIRLAAMDSYDGIVWLVSGSDTSGSGRFERVGNRILPVPDGDPVRLQVEIAGYEDVWMPTVGTMRSAMFSGPASGDLQAAFRYNRATGTAAAPIGLVESDGYTLEAHIPEEVDDPAGDDLALGSVSLPPMPTGESIDDMLAIVEERAVSIVGDQATPYAQAKALEAHFQQHAFSDGGPDASGRAKVNSGHSLFAIARFLGAEETQQLVGNGEHYAATMALMARELGLPARVVIGFAPDASGKVEVRGADADAWVEIAFSGSGWIPFHPTPDEDNVPDEQTKRTKVVEQLSTQEPQPDPYLEPPDEAEELERDADEDDSPDLVAGGGGFELPKMVALVARFMGPPLAAFVVFAGTVVLLKAVRRRRRRTRGSNTDRVAGAWRELTDVLLDRGLLTMTAGTRVELASAVSDDWGSGRDAAHRFDAAMFGPLDPTEADVDELWRHADRERSDLRGSELRSRLRTALSTSSLRRSFRRPGRKS